MEVSGDKVGLLEWTTVSTPGEREEGSTKGMVAVVGKKIICIYKMDFVGGSDEK